MDFDLTILPGVFHPSLYFSSRYFANVLAEQIDFSGKRVLDLGCGSGILSLVAARGGALVVAVDINPQAVVCTQMNAATNGLSERITVIESDLFEKIPDAGTFDYLITNPPFFEGEPTSAADAAWKGGADQHFIRTVAHEAGKLLQPGGSVLCILSSDGMVAEQVGLFIEGGFTWKLLSSKRYPFERLYIFSFTPTQ